MKAVLVEQFGVENLEAGEANDRTAGQSELLVAAERPLSARLARGRRQRELPPRQITSNRAAATPYMRLLRAVRSLRGSRVLGRWVCVQPGTSVRVRRTRCSKWGSYLPLSRGRAMSG